MRVKGNTWAPDFEITFLHLICCVIIFAACGYAKLSLIKGGGGTATTVLISFVPQQKQLPLRRVMSQTCRLLSSPVPAI